MKIQTFKQIEYKLLNNGSAVIFTRQPKVVYDELSFVFLTAPSDATAIIETGEISLYRKLNEGSCTVPIKKLSGEVRVTVVITNGKTPLQKWLCEELKVEKLKDGGILIYPNDLNLPQTIVDLRLENHNIREEYRTIKEELEAVKKRLEEITEPYDFI